MNSKAQLTVDVIAKVAELKITIANAAKLLNPDAPLNAAISSIIEKRGCGLLFMATQGVNRRIKRRIQ